MGGVNDVLVEGHAYWGLTRSGYNYGSTTYLRQVNLLEDEKVIYTHLTGHKAGDEGMCKISTFLKWMTSSASDKQVRSAVDKMVKDGKGLPYTLMSMASAEACCADVTKAPPPVTCKHLKLPKLPNGVKVVKGTDLKVGDVFTVAFSIAGVTHNHTYLRCQGGDLRLKDMQFFDGTGTYKDETVLLHL